MRRRACPACGSFERCYWHWLDGWLEVMCGWCNEPLHGIQVEIIEGGADEAA